ncbi:MAG: aldehyde dehydrogenase family protein [Candidatus Gottesmanbacteria bacterium]
MPNFFEEIYTNPPAGGPPIYKYFCDGEWLTSKSGKTVDIFSPVTDEIVGKIQSLNQAEIDEAMEAAFWAQQIWQKTPLEKRARILHLAADWLKEHKEYLSNLLILEIGKNIAEAEDEIIRTADLIDYFAEAGRSLQGETLDSDSFPGYEKGKQAVISRVPVGVVLSISPFNYPVNLSASKIAPALITGNAVVLKPATYGSLSALHLVEVFRKAGLPPGILNTVTGTGAEIGDYLVTHPRVSMISFTGSSLVGEKIARKAGMIPLLFECGGNNPAIVLPDADLDLTAKEIIKGAYSFSGQRCTAIKYVLAQREVLDKLKPMLLDELEKLVKLGDPREKTTKMVGPLISKDAVEIVENRIIKAKVAGAEIVRGGRRRGLYYEPTILDGVKSYWEIVKIETFGPVVSLISVSNINEAVKIINDSLYGLQACIFTKDEGTAIKLAQRINVGTVQINSKPQRGPDHFPFLGIKGSGVGVQGVKYTLEAMTRFKPVVLNKPE